MNFKQITLFVICVGAFVLLGASCGGNEWSKDHFGNSYGLWKYCKGTECIDSLIKSDKLRTERAFSLLAVLASIVASILALLGICCTNKIKGFVITIFLLAAVICMVIALSVYTDEYKDSVWFHEWGWSYYLGWAGCAVAIIGSILGCFTSSDYEIV